MGVTFPIPDFDADYESLPERGCFFEIFRNFDCTTLIAYEWSAEEDIYEGPVKLIHQVKIIQSFLYVMLKLLHFIMLSCSW